jgi:uncharacterized lipoprotein YddW (UPF0748 family)
MNKSFLIILSLLFPFTITYAQPKYEVRAAWVTTAYGLDWPRTKATSNESMRKQQTELIRILDKLKAANFNTVLFQTRSRDDVYYRSKIEPMAAVLTGKVNGDPGYDPLQFAIDESHKRGMECIAWIVSIPLGSKSHVKSFGKLSALYHTHDGICIPYRTDYFLNPSNPSTKDYLMDIVREITTGYDIDGIVFDYLRYPENAVNFFPDKKEYDKYGNGRSLSDWRRDNITDIVRYLYKGIKNIKPWVKVSTCPVGKYRDTSRYSAHGWNAFNAVYQDPEKWMQEGIQDQLYPMMYFRGNNFYPFALDWFEQSNSRHIVPALGTYFLSPKEGNWNNEDIVREINFIRQHNLSGESHFRMEYLMKDTKGVYSGLLKNLYLFPALQPAMKWLDSIPPTSPNDLKVVREDDWTTLTWRVARDNDARNAPTYVIYASDTYPVDITKPENIIAQRIEETKYTYMPLYPWQTKTYFAVTAVDRYGNESRAVQEHL